MFDRKIFITAASVTVHCLIGCLIGEITGLFIGVSLSWTPPITIAFATILAFISGLLLAVISILKKHKISYLLAIKTVWFGEVISISGMEIAMNGVDYYIGGVNAVSIYDSIFWLGLIAAIPAGYITALPINYWLVKKNLKKCH